MADITMCSGKKEKNVCPLREKCVRYISERNVIAQSYFSDIPYNFTEESCEEFWEIKKGKKKNV